MKQTSLTILLLLATMNICAQSITYSYDNAGAIQPNCRKGYYDLSESYTTKK